jgi:F-box/leucine-rich repeat protein 10/11
MSKRMKMESAMDDERTINGDGHHSRHSLPHQFSIGGSLLQDIAYSAQQALSQRPEEELMPIDPALQTYANEDYQSSSMAPSYPAIGDMIMSSIEQHHSGSVPMDGIEFSGPNNQQQGPSIEPLTPGPPSQFNDGHYESSHHTQRNGYMPYPPAQHDAVRPLSSPVSPRQVRAMSPTSPTTHNHNMFTTNSDFPPPVTPTTHHRTAPSSGHKSGQTSSRARHSRTPKSTPGGRRRDSKDSIKLEQGLTMAMTLGMGINLDFIDPNLDQASRDLIKQLQAEEHGLRRRSRGEAGTAGSPSHAQVTPTRAQAGV